MNTNAAFEPVQLRWKSNSCAYDVVILALYHLWCENSTMWNKHFSKQFKELRFFTGKFQQVFDKKLKLERARYLWRCKLHKRNPANYTMDGFTDMTQLLPDVLQLKENLITKVSTCVSCKKEVERYQCKNSWCSQTIPLWSSYLKFVHHKKIVPSMQGYINYSNKIPLTRLSCCSDNYFLTETYFEQEPTVLGFLLPDFMRSTSQLIQAFQFNKTIKIAYENS